ncbi:hypothetical protein MGN70_011573 [Eutypa lata]|nr:hypothetical protein MGN70_011573 [Eutypa lata]
MGDPKTLKSTSQSISSPDGLLVAILSPTSITVTDAKSSSVVHTIKLPPDIPSDVTSFVWSSSSKRILVAVTDQIHVFSIVDDNFHASIQHPSSSSATRSTFVKFGASDDEIYAWSAFGIKLTIFSLVTSKALEINNPKFYTSSSALRGISFRPPTHHLAILTQASGKDMISIHDPKTREVQRAWSPDTIDAQGLQWSPDGRWLVVWESASQGHKVLFYTQDGHLFKDWRGPISPAPNSDLGLGVKLVMFSPDSHRVAIADGSCYICIINTLSMSEEMRLQHAQSVEPKDAIQNIWQEQVYHPNTKSTTKELFRNN